MYHLGKGVARPHGVVRVKLPFKAIEHPEDEAYQLLRITVCRRLWSQICAELKERE
jgi:hypothetical protein